jgi:hypothetical protein
MFSLNLACDSILSFLSESDQDDEFDFFSSFSLVGERVDLVDGHKAYEINSACRRTLAVKVLGNSDGQFG